jgi:hypothetical protein
MKLLGLILTFTFAFSTIDSVLKQYFVLVRYKLSVPVMCGTLLQLLTPVNLIA